jgi:hypothetical protein
MARESSLRPRRRSVSLIVGTVLGASLVIGTAAAQTTLGNAICDTGAGKLISMGLVGLSLLLVYSGIFDGYRGLKNSNKKNTKQRAQQGSEYGAAGKKVVGAVVISGAPTMLSTMGFSLLNCVSAVQIFA